MSLDCIRPAGVVDYNGRVPRRTERILIVLVLLAAAWLRVYHLDNVPPGWRDDEVVETTVHAALIQQGHWLLFFPQAEGHEPLYHYLSAAWISAAGSSLFIVRLLSVFFGLLSVAALYQLARHLFGGRVALVAYLFVFHRPLLPGRWRALALAAGATVVLVLPLAVAIARTPQGQARLSVVGAPLADLLRGDPRYVLRNTAETLAMPAFTGDPEYLYNIPGRPLFEPLGALLFGLGVLLAAWHWRQPRYAFVLIWLLGGLAPAFVSTPSGYE